MESLIPWKPYDLTIEFALRAWDDFCLAPLIVDYWTKTLCIKEFSDLLVAACCSLQWVFCVGFVSVSTRP